jgi:hypothetical protein
VPYQPRNAAPPARYTCYRAAGPIAIDGRLDEPSWQRAPKSNAFVDNGRLGRIPRFPPGYVKFDAGRWGFNSGGGKSRCAC